MSVDRLDQAAEYRRQAQEIRTLVEKIWITEAREQAFSDLSDEVFPTT